MHFYRSRWVRLMRIKPRSCTMETGWMSPTSSLNVVAASTGNQPLATIFQLILLHVGGILHGIATQLYSVVSKCWGYMEPGAVEQMHYILIFVNASGLGSPGLIPGTTRKKSSGSGTGSTQPREYN
jgi:hypothetical protein